MNQCERRIMRGMWAEDLFLARCTPPIGPRNAYSNVAYFFFGTLAVPASGFEPAAWVFMFAMMWLGIGSFLYHAYKTLWANHLDWSGMYGVFGALGAYAMAPDHPAIVYIMTLIGVVFATMLPYHFKEIGANTLLGMLLLACLVPAVFNGSATLAGASMALFVLGKLCWLADKEHTVLGLWGHAIWHVTTAAAFLFMFLALGG